MVTAGYRHAADGFVVCNRGGWSVESVSQAADGLLLHPGSQFSRALSRNAIACGYLRWRWFGWRSFGMW